MSLSKNGQPRTVTSVAARWQADLSEVVRHPKSTSGAPSIVISLAEPARIRTPTLIWVLVITITSWIPAAKGRQIGGRLRSTRQLVVSGAGPRQRLERCAAFASSESIG
jgi:hypothetical protein